MGCFMQGPKNRKIRLQGDLCAATSKTINPYDNKPAMLPEPVCSVDEKTGGRIRVGTASTFRSRVRTIQHVSWLINNRTPPRPLPLPHQKLDYEKIKPCLKPLPNDRPGVAVIHSDPKPLPPPKHYFLITTALRSFTYDEILTVCNYFCPERCLSEGSAGSVYKASILRDGIGGEHRIEATIMRLVGTSSQPHKEFVLDVNTIASLKHPHLCKLIGFHARENTGERMLVYERLPHGSLDRLLYGRAKGLPPIDWCTRLKIALCAAQGLAYLHEEGPFQAMYSEFKAANVQIDRDFSAKLSEYGFGSCNLETQIPCNSSTAAAYLAPETLVRGLLTPKSNVWSFGIMLLELLTGRQNMERCYPEEERNLVKWSPPFLKDGYRLALIMDPRLIARNFSIKSAKVVADLALRCLQKDPSDRPTMRAAVEILKNVQDVKYSPMYPLREPISLPAIKCQDLNRCQKVF
eukprot:Gb_17778 [translate_table: standard]